MRAEIYRVSFLLTVMEITVTYSIELNKEDIKRIEKRLNTSPSLTPFISMKDYLKERMKGAAILELDRDYEENLTIKCDQKYFQIHIR